MRTLSLLVLILTLAATAGAARTTPSLKLVKSMPLVVQGSGFKPGEAVRVTLLAPPHLRGVSRTVTKAGTFRALIPVTSIVCARAERVRAIGSKGSRATLVLPEGASRCWPPPPTDG